MAKTYHVSAANGNDNNNGSQGKPLKTIQAGVDKARAGDTVLVRAGVYKEQVTIRVRGQESKKYTIAGQEGESVVVDGSGLGLGDAAGLFNVQSSQHVVISGFELRLSSGRGVVIEACDGISLTHCDIHSCQSGGIFAQDSSNLVVENCQVHNCAQKFVSAGQQSLTVAIMFRRCETVRVRRNQCYENAAEGIAIIYARQATISHNTCYDNRAAQILISSTRDSLVDSNFCYHTGREAHLDLAGKRPPAIAKSDRARYQDAGTWHTQDLTISNNFASGCAAGFYTDRKGGMLTQVKLVHNTFINSDNAAIFVDPTIGHTETVVENNLLASTNGSPLVKVQNPAGVLWRYNMWSQYPSNYANNPANDIIDANVGLRDINMPVVAGQLTPAAYELTGTSPAVNNGRQSTVADDFWGNQRDGKPDMGAHEFDGTEPPPGGEVDLPPSGVRVSAGVAVLYDFGAGWGDTITDVSGQGQALDLTVRDMAAVEWGEGFLTVKAPTLIRSGVPATKVSTAAKITGEITVEAWVRPAKTSQDGPARIVSISRDTNQRNVTLAQGLKEGESPDLYNVRLRTTTSSENGIPSVSSPQGSAVTELTHVVFTRDVTGRAIIYLNGQERTTDQLAGDLSPWDMPLELFLANEATLDRPWLGDYHLVAIFGRALKSEEVVHNYLAGLPPAKTVDAAFAIQPGQEIGVLPHLVNFNSGESTADDGIASYAWEFGDGSTSTEPNPTHMYETTGVFSVKLTVTDTQGQSDTLTRNDLITVTTTALPPLPGDYARFVVANVVESRILSFGIQYPDFRCVLASNSAPFQTELYRDIDDIVALYEINGTVKVVWIDYPEAGEGQ